MRNIFCAFVILLIAATGTFASEVWLSDVGTVGGGASQGVPDLNVAPGANTLYIWARPDAEETLKNVSLNLRSSNDAVLDFTEVIMDNPMIAENPFGPDIFRYEFIADTPEGSVVPAVDPDSLDNFQGFTVASTQRAGLGMGPAAIADPNDPADPHYDPATDAFRLATVNFDVTGSEGSMTELWLQIGTNGANLEGKGSAETLFVFGDPQDPPLNADSDRNTDSATFDAKLTVGEPSEGCPPGQFPHPNDPDRCIPEPSSVVLACLGLLGLTFYGWRRR